MNLRIPSLAIALFIVQTACSQQGAHLFHRMNGLTSQTDNNYIYQDKKGFIWVSSIDGLNRFDGGSVRTYYSDPGDSTSLADDNIHSNFFEDEMGNLWFSSNTAIHKYDRRLDQFTKYGTSSAIAGRPNEYQVLFRDAHARELWVRNKNELFVVDEQTPDKMVEIGAFNLHFKCRIYQLPGRKEIFLVVPTPTTVRVYVIEHRKLVQQFELFKDETDKKVSVYSTFCTPDGRLWVGTNHGLVLFESIQESTSPIYCESKMHGRNVIDIDYIEPVDRQYLLLSAKNTGIFLFDINQRAPVAEVLQLVEGRPRPINTEVECLYLDRDQTLWIGLVGKGVLFTNFRKKKFNAILQGAVSGPVISVSGSPDGTIWYATSQELLFRKRGSSQFEKINNPAIGRIYRILHDPEGNLWVCSSSGLLVRQAGQKQFKKLEPDAPAHTFPGFTYIAALADSTLLASSQFFGLQKITRQGNHSFQLSPFSDTLGTDGVFTVIAQNEAGRLFICKHNAQIHILSPTGNEWKLDTSITFLPMVTGLIADQGGHAMWVASDAGLFRIQTSHHLTYELVKVQDFPIRSLKGIVQDERGVLWTSSTDGLATYDPGDGSMHRFGLSDGLQDLEFSFWSVYKGERGQLFFGGINGINYFDPSAIIPFDIAARPVITQILVNDEIPSEEMLTDNALRSVSEIRSLKLPFKKNKLSFRFAALEYSDPGSNRYRYQLVGLDKGFIDNGTEAFVSYASIPPGNYTLRVEASNSDGYWSGEAAELGITILPPLYQTWWFRILLIFLLSFVLYHWYRYRIRIIQRREAFKRKEAEYKQLVAETETAVLRLQMNPHFIFNSMNSINSFILNKNIQAAHDYLHSFSKLMRNVLERSEEYFTTVAEEIEWLDLYLKTEAMRMGKKLRYRFEVSSQLDPDETILPTMILQPFVENAIWHGISPKKGPGRILIRFERTTDYLLCEVEDDGVGRNFSSNTDSRPQRTSRALQITRRRLELLSETQPNKPHFQVIDLEDDNKQACGTKVELFLPFF